MPLSWSTYYGLARVQNGGPETKNWSVLYNNPQQTSLMFKSMEQHHHNAATPMAYPGYNFNTPATPTQGTLTVSSAGGNIAAGTTVGVRFSFIDNLGLETQASPEITASMPALVTAPSGLAVGAPIATPVPGGLTGGTYIYALTKGKGTGETNISTTSVITVPFSAASTSSYTVPLTLPQSVSQYNAIDGTDHLNIYRSTGYDAAFVRLVTYTLAANPNTTTYTDNNIVASTAPPPQSPTFGSNNSLNISWSSLAIPGNATRFRVYVTQQPGVYGSSSLLQDYLLNNPATPLPNNYTYQGIETLIADFPKEFAQGIGNPPPVYLPTEAYGAPYYTQPANAFGWQTYNFAFPVGGNNSTPLQGAAYVDPTSNQLKVALSTPAVAGGPVAFMTLAAAGQGYAHPTTESGGHLASHIYAAPTGVGGPTQDILNSIFSTPVAGPAANYRIQATNIYKATATPATLQNSSPGVWMPMPDMLLTNIQPDFPGQQHEFNFDCAMALVGVGAPGQIISTQLYINGVAINETFTAQGGSYIGSGLGYARSAFHYATPITRSNNTYQVYWMASYTGYVQALGTNTAGLPPQRSFYAKELW